MNQHDSKRFIWKVDFVASPNYGTGARKHTLRLLASNTVEPVFEGCRIPAENLLGEELKGCAIYAGRSMVRDAARLNGTGLTGDYPVQCVFWDTKQSEIGEKILEFMVLYYHGNSEKHSHRRKE